MTIATHIIRKEDGKQYVPIITLHDAGSRLGGSGLVPCKLTPEPHFAGLKSLL